MIRALLRDVLLSEQSVISFLTMLVVYTYISLYRAGTRELSRGTKKIAKETFKSLERQKVCVIKVQNYEKFVFQYCLCV